MKSTLFAAYIARRVKNVVILCQFYLGAFITVCHKDFLTCLYFVFRYL